MCTYFDALLAAEVCAQTLDRHVYLQVKQRHINLIVAPCTFVESLQFINQVMHI